MNIVGRSEYILPKELQSQDELIPCQYLVLERHSVRLVFLLRLERILKSFNRGQRCSRARKDTIWAALSRASWKYP